MERNLFFTGIFIATLTADLAFRDFVQDKVYAGDHFVAEFLYSVGDKNYFLPAMVASYGASHLFKQKYFHNTMLLSFQSIAISQLYTELVKRSIVRVRPRNSPDNPFVRAKGNQSFVSGHASGIWSVMTIFAGRYPQLKHLFYGFASAVSLARIYEDAHWMSDVFMGSLLGYGVAKLTLRLNHEPLKGNLSLAPFYDHYGQGVKLKFVF
ncbi:MAG: phosphatase PAP2 family protein [Bacteroidales bacterium]